MIMMKLKSAKEKISVMPAGSVYRCGIGGNARDYRRCD